MNGDIELLRRTKERVLQGWTQERGGASGGPGGTRRLCLVRARIQAARQMTGDFSYGDTYRLAEEALQAAVERRGYYGEPHFNDAPETTQADVIALIDEAIVSLADSTKQPGAQRDPTGSHSTCGAPGELSEAVPA